MLRTFASHVVVAFFVVTAAESVAHAAPEDSVEAGPRPAWVDVAREMPEGAPRAAATGDVYDELSDEQVHVHAPTKPRPGRRPITTERYVRTRRHIVTGTGVERASELRFSFDPTYEHLVFHAIRVIRDGIARDVLDLPSIRVFSEESGADARIYDGTMTALVVVPDTRPGDVIDSEVTIEGENPVFGGRFADSLLLGSSVWTGRLRVRLLLPVAREVDVKVSDPALAVATRVLGSEREYVIDRENVPAIKNEQDSPSWFRAAPVLRVSDYHSWAEVAQWAWSLFHDADKADASVLAKAAELRRAHATPEARALAAIRFVQDEVRYLGIEMGEHSHRPHSSGSVLRQRFGDCKDKSLLLVSLLRALEIDANVALVNTRLAERVRELLPSHGAFNHAVVRLQVGAHDYWVDATASLEGGTLARYTTLPYGRALVLSEATRDLAELPRETLSAPTTTLREIYTPDAAEGEGAKLEVQTTFRGDAADAMRHRLARTAHEEIASQYLNYYAGYEPAIQPADDLVVADDRAANVLVVTERYLIPDFFREGLARLHGAAISSPLESPRTSLRATPLRLLYPFWERQEVELHLRNVPQGSPAEASRATDLLSFDRRVHVDGQVVRVEFELRTRADSVPVESVATHLRNVEDVRDLLHPVVELAGAEPPVNWTAAAWCGGGVFTFVAVLFGYGYGPRWWRRRGWRKEQAFGRGDTATTARTAKSRAEAERDVLSRRCACGLKPEGPLPESTWSSIQLGDTTITVVRAPCACGVGVRRYYVLPAE